MTDEVIKLEGVLNIAKVDAMHTRLEKLVRNATPVWISVQDVSRADTSILQLLVVFFKQMAEQGNEVKWKGVSSEFVAAAKLLGLDKELKLDE